ncbi:MAG: indole-3-glycerol phosphate synthase TrpC [Clostridiales bacterium]|jgi:indole-3-glycerol phosphate synthase|nr:indole-3-glycerol phosphate synthase TrpC [Clostridiales bacterium]
MILDDITQARKIQLEAEKAAYPRAKAEAEKISRPALDFRAALKREKISVIAEVKKASPSKGVICADFRPAETAAAYERSGADAVSVLTEERFFLGANEYLSEIRREIALPLLRKDFVLDPFQIYHARALGADAVLLIAALLPPPVMREYVKIAEALSLCVLAEAHDERELEACVAAGASVIGVNNRDLRDFSVDLSLSARLFSLIPGDEYVRVAESGIKTAEDARFLRESGADAVLVGEALMRGGGFNELFGGI